jgi:glycoprotein endo-alpha-1,2-mannosidase
MQILALVVLLLCALPVLEVASAALGVGAFYYVWYGTPAVDGAFMHWNHSILPHWSADVRMQHAG